jgi:hypothetical protein
MISMKLLILKNMVKISDSEKDQILLIKNKMNSQRDPSLVEYPTNFAINSSWFIGFIEGDGTFGIKNGSPYFQDMAAPNQAKKIQVNIR